MVLQDSVSDRLCHKHCDKALPCSLTVIQNRNKDNDDYDHGVIMIMMMMMSSTWCFPFWARASLAALFAAPGGLPSWGRPDEWWWLELRNELFTTWNAALAWVAFSDFHSAKHQCYGIHLGSTTIGTMQYQVITCTISFEEHPCICQMTFLWIIGLMKMEVCGMLMMWRGSPERMGWGSASRALPGRKQLFKSGVSYDWGTPND